MGAFISPESHRVIADLIGLDILLGARTDALKETKTTCVEFRDKLLDGKLTIKIEFDPKEME